MVRVAILALCLVGAAFLPAALCGGELDWIHWTGTWTFGLIAAAVGVVVAVVWWCRGLAARIAIKVDLSRIPTGSLLSLPADEITNHSRELVAIISRMLPRFLGWLFRFFVRGRADQLAESLERFCREQGHETATASVVASWLATAGIESVKSAVHTRIVVVLWIAILSYAVSMAASTSFALFTGDGPEVVEPSDDATDE